MIFRKECAGDLDVWRYGRQEEIFMLTVVWHLVQQNNTEHLGTKDSLLSKSTCIVLTQRNPISKTGHRPQCIDTNVLKYCFSL